MKKNLLYLSLVSLFILAAGFVIMKHRKDETKKDAIVCQLLERRGSQAQSDEWLITKKAGEKLINTVKANPYDKKSLVSLANLMVMEGRATGNYAYYDVAAMK